MWGQSDLFDLLKINIDIAWTPRGIERGSRYDLDETMKAQLTSLLHWRSGDKYVL